MSDPSAGVLQELVELLDLESLEVNLFRGQSRDLGGKSVFGGQVLGQALVAAERTVEQGASAHSLHGYFLRRGAVNAAIVYEVDRLRDGRSFMARRVQAIQNGQPIFSMIASFQCEEVGLEHHAPMPLVPAPEQLESDAALRARLAQTAGPLPARLIEALTQPLAIEFRPVQPLNWLAPEVREPLQQIWFRAAGALPDDPSLHRGVLAYASDFNLLTTALLPHGLSMMQPNIVLASLDHALWFHRTPRADDWMLYSMDSPGAQGARGLSRGLIYNREGLLVASVVQESLMRVRSDS